MLFDPLLSNFIQTSQDTPKIQLARDLQKALNSVKGLESRFDELAHAFVRIEKAVSPRPIPLFGQAVPSLAFNRLSIHFGRWNSETENWQPGDEIISTLISERSLSTLLFRQNMSSSLDRICLTTESTLGRRLRPYVAETDLFRQAARNEIADTQDEILSELQDCIDKVESASGKMTRSALEDLERVLKHTTSQNTVSFYLQRHAGNLNRERIDMIIEAATAVTNARRIAEAATAPLQIERSADPSEIQDIEQERLVNPVLFAILDTYTVEECALLSDLLTDVWTDLSARHGLLIEEAEGRLPDAKFKDGSRLSYKEQDIIREEARTVLRARSSLLNENLLARRAQANPYHLTARMNVIHGDTTHIHSSNLDDTHVFQTLTISGARLSGRFAEPAVDETSTVLTLEITHDDLMTALRGHPAGEMIPCSVTYIAGASVPRNAGRSTDELTDFKRRVADSQVGKKLDEVSAICAKIRSLSVNTTSKKGRSELADALRELIRAVKSFWIDLDEVITEDMSGLEAEILGRQLSENLSSIAAHIPEEFRSVLRLTHAPKG